MKILFVISAFGVLSGAEQVLLDFLKSETSIDPVFLLIGSNPSATNFFEGVASKNNIYFVESKTNLNSTLSRFLTMGIKRYFLNVKLLSNHTIRYLKNDDTIKCIYYDNSFETAMFYPLFKGKKRVAHIHDMIDMFRPMHKHCVLEGCKAVDSIITVSEAAKNQLVSNGIDQEKITVAHNGLMCNAMPYKDKEDLEKITLGFVGSAIKRKGLDTFVSIANQTLMEMRSRGDIRQIRIILITNSDIKNTYCKESLGKLNPSIQMCLYQKLAREKVLKRYEEMDMLIVPSRFDPLPTVVIEAIMRGTAVMGSNKDGIPEMIKNKELLFELENVKEASEKLLAWLNKPLKDKQQIMRDLQQHIISDFSSEEKKRKVTNVLERL